jgi:hypothetical protein
MANKFDIYFQVLSSIEQQTTFKFVTFGPSSTIGVQGFPQLINKWLKCFLTTKGSDATNLNYGTVFTSLLGSNVPLHDARDVAALALQQCNNQIITMQSGDLTLTSTERLASANIIKFLEKPEVPGFELYIELKNQAQELLVFSLPTISVS